MLAPDDPVTAAASAVVDLTRGECLRRLATGVLGRVIVSDGALPAAYPVLYLLDTEEVLFCASAASRLAAASRGRVVGFQADELHIPTRTGWSVLAVGQAYEVVDSSRPADLEDRLPGPWIPDPAACILAVPLQQLTGRQLTRPPT